MKRAQKKTEPTPPLINVSKTPANIDKASIDEIRKFVSTSTPQLHKSGSSLICTRCSNGEPIGVVKYRVELIASDTSGKTIFVLLDEDTTKLINMTTTKLLDSQTVMKDRGA
ncbi:unnamed protein product [Arabidopsis halleri]